MLSIRLLVLVVGLIGATAILSGANAEEHKKYGGLHGVHGRAATAVKRPHCGSSAWPKLLCGNLGKQHQRTPSGRLSCNRARPSWFLQIEQACSLPIQHSAARC